MIMALTAGIVSFLSPCVLPLVPGYVSFISGVSINEIMEMEDRPRLFDKTQISVIFNALLFISGFSLVFVALGASATWIGSFFSSNLGVLTKVSGLVIIFFGLIKLNIIRINWFFKDMRFHLNTRKKGAFFSLILGMAFAFGWTPCTGPILGAILTYAGTVDQAGSGIRLLLIYSAGLGIPFLLTAIFIQYFFKVFNRIKKHLWIIDKGTGLILILMGILIFNDSFTAITGWFSMFNAFTL
ncbi:cytochrome c biogenesis CcdA family protein [Desulfobacula sp.]|uniref:cytochrome c biogenesis CcdA family protein n=1 Tax=Desulfobacula sp. TaxID=2593537 RepID=UPI002611276B|nr:cytochrome c biogenesis protein CcdA [Desulfobacula sp.]